MSTPNLQPLITPVSKKNVLVGRHLKRAREQICLSLKELAEAYNRQREIALEQHVGARKLDYTALSRLENWKAGTTDKRGLDYSHVSEATAQVLADTLGVSLSELVVPLLSQNETPSLAVSVAEVSHENLSESFNILLPFIAVSSRTAFINNIEGNEDYSLKEMRRVYLRDSSMKTRYKDAVIFEVEDDSMEPEIESGDEVIATPISQNQWEYEQNFIAVVSYNNTVTIKKIIGNDLTNKGVLALRPWRDELAAHTVPRIQIRSIYKVFQIRPQPRRPRSL